MADSRVHFSINVKQPRTDYLTGPAWPLGNKLLYISGEMVPLGDSPIFDALKTELERQLWDLLLNGSLMTPNELRITLGLDPF